MKLLAILHLFSTISAGFFKRADDQTTTTYGASLPSWRLDTSREYWLSRNGLWNSDAPPTTRTYNFEVSNVVGWPDGVAKNLTVINGKFPGPVIECNEGDTLVIHVTNKADTACTIHYHGIFQRGTPFMDGIAAVAQCPIPPEKSFTYTFKVEQSGTYWYHSHYGTQFSEGLYGPLIVHSPKEEKYYKAGRHYTQELVVFLTDWYHNSTYELRKDFVKPGVAGGEPLPDNGLIQGQNKFDCSKQTGYDCRSDSEYPVIPMKPDEKYRIRLINTGAYAQIHFSIDKHSMHVIEADGTLVQPVKLEVLKIAEAQRYSVLLTTKSDQNKPYWIRARLNSNCFARQNPNLDQDVKGILAYPAFTKEIQAKGGKVPRLPDTQRSTEVPDSDLCGDLDHKLLVLRNVTNPPKADVLYHLTMNFHFNDQNISKAYFNDSSWTPLAGMSTLGLLLDRSASQADDRSSTPAWARGQLVLEEKQPKVIDLLVTNENRASHPFHLHGYNFWVLETGSGVYDMSTYSPTKYTDQNPALRDVVAISQTSWMLIRFKTDNPGVWAFHCHNIWHLAAGLMAQFATNTDGLKNIHGPTAWSDLCVNNNYAAA